MERGFEKITSVAISILGNSVTFVIAFCTIIFWLTNSYHYAQNIHDFVGDLILGVAFLSLFIIQKSSNRLSGSLNLKVNELIASHKYAHNAVINAEAKTELEITILSKEYTLLVEQEREREMAKVNP